MKKPKSNRKKKTEASSTKSHDKLSLLRRKLKLRQQQPTQIEPEDAENRLHNDVATRITKTKLFQRASPMKLVRLYQSMTPEQVDAIRRAEFSGMVDIKCSKLRPELCKFLMQSFDPMRCELVFPGRGSIPVTEESVYTVLGVPWGNRDVRYEIDANAISFMAEQFGKKGTDMNPCSWCQDRTHAIHCPESKFIIRMLRKAAKSSAEKGVQKACMLYCMVKYLDSLELKGLDVSNQGTRVSVWTNDMVKKAISQDMSDDGTFGMAPLKAEFRDPEDPEVLLTNINEANTEEYPGITDIGDSGTDFRENVTTCAPEEPVYQSMLFPDKQVFAAFFEHNSEVRLTTSERTRFTQAIEESCYDFEVGLRKMLRTFTCKPEPPATEQEPRPTTEPEAKPTTGQEPADLIKRQNGREMCIVVKKKKRHTREEQTTTTTAKKKKQKNIHIQQEQTTTMTAEKSESNGSTDDDYVPDEDEQDRNESNVSLEDESFDIMGSCSAKPDTTDYRILKRKRTAERPEPESQLRAKDVTTRTTINDDGTSGDTPMTEGAHRKLDECSIEKVQVHTEPVVEETKESQLQAEDVTTTNTTNDDGTSEDTPMTEGAHRKFDKCSIEKVQVHTEPVVEETKEYATQEHAGGKEDPEARVTFLASAGEGECAASSEHFAGVQDPNNLSNDTSKGEGDHCDQNNINHSIADTHKDVEQVTQLGETRETRPYTKSQDDISWEMGQDAQGNNEEWKNEINFFECVAYSPPKNAFHIPKFETPVFLDLELYRPTEEAFQSIINSHAGKEQINADGLANFLNYSPTAEFKKLLSEMDPKPISFIRKKVTFENQLNPRQQKVSDGISSPSRCRTRSAAREDTLEGTTKEQSTTKRQSPRRTIMKNITEKNKTIPIEPSTQKITRSKAAFAAPIVNDVNEQSPRGGQQRTGHLTSKKSPDSMIKKLSFSTAMSDKRRKQLDEAPDAPPFDLGFDTAIGNENRCNKENTEEPVGQPGHFLCDEENIEEPAAKPGHSGCNKVKAKGSVDQQDPSTDSITPVPHEYQKRIIKNSRYEKSPFNQRNFNVTKSTNDLYNWVTRHGWESQYPIRKETIVDVGHLYIVLADLADSVAPGKKLVNHVAEIAIHIIDVENKNRKKFIMPLRISRYLIDSRLNLKDVRRVFCMSSTHRLDHKELICFPTLQSFTHKLSNDEDSGHYFLLNLNLKAQRFEIMDSLTRNGEALMMETCHLLVASIKVLWTREYATSSIDISNYPMEVIPCPVQTNTWDCGFFMLKLLEEWHGRKVELFEQKDLPIIRKLYNEKWVQWPHNMVQWHLLL